MSVKAEIKISWMEQGCVFSLVYLFLLGYFMIIHKAYLNIV